ncbi:partial Motility protein B, partial [Patescibacteria group bacterium]
IKDKRNVLSRLIPFWVIGSVAGLLLMLIFLGFLYVINSASNPVLAKLYVLKDSFNVAPVAVAEPIPTPQTPQAPALIDELNSFLKPEVDRGEVQLLKQNGKTVIRIMSKNLFASGSDKIMTQHYPLLDKIGQALTTLTERITIVGHTDSSPMFSARFPSNWELSKARAVSVTELLLSNHKITAPVVSEGRADTQPMVPNDSAEHKAMNRRVEIIVIKD